MARLGCTSGAPPPEENGVGGSGQMAIAVAAQSGKRFAALPSSKGKPRGLTKIFAKKASRTCSTVGTFSY